MPSGYVALQPGVVAPCAMGQFKTAVGADTVCVSCAPGVTTSDVASTSEAACTSERWPGCCWPRQCVSTLLRQACKLQPDDVTDPLAGVSAAASAHTACCPHQSCCQGFTPPPSSTTPSRQHTSARKATFAPADEPRLCLIRKRRLKTRPCRAARTAHGRGASALCRTTSAVS